jgi:hypothetical protein
MDEARRGGGARGDVFIRGRGKPERAIGLGLESCDGDRPRFCSAPMAGFYSAFGSLDLVRMIRSRLL